MQAGAQAKTPLQNLTLNTAALEFSDLDIKEIYNFLKISYLYTDFLNHCSRFLLPKEKYYDFFRLKEESEQMLFSLYKPDLEDVQRIKSDPQHAIDLCKRIVDRLAVTLGIVRRVVDNNLPAVQALFPRTKKQEIEHKVLSDNPRIKEIRRKSLSGEAVLTDPLIIGLSNIEFWIRKRDEVCSLLPKELAILADTLTILRKKIQKASREIPTASVKAENIVSSATKYLKDDKSSPVVVLDQKGAASDEKHTSIVITNAEESDFNSSGFYNKIVKKTQENRSVVGYFFLLPNNIDRFKKYCADISEHIHKLESQSGGTQVNFSYQNNGTLIPDGKKWEPDLKVYGFPDRKQTRVDQVFVNRKIAEQIKSETINRGDVFKDTMERDLQVLYQVKMEPGEDGVVEVKEVQLNPRYGKLLSQFFASKLVHKEIVADINNLEQKFFPDKKDRIFNRPVPTPPKAVKKETPREKAIRKSLSKARTKHKARIKPRLTNKIREKNRKLNLNKQVLKLGTQTPNELALYQEVKRCQKQSQGRSKLFFRAIRTLMDSSPFYSAVEAQKINMQLFLFLYEGIWNTPSALHPIIASYAVEPNIKMQGHFKIFSQYFKKIEEDSKKEVNPKALVLAGKF